MWQQRFIYCCLNAFWCIRQLRGQVLALGCDDWESWPDTATPPEHLCDPWGKWYPRGKKKKTTSCSLGWMDWAANLAGPTYGAYSMQCPGLCWAGASGHFGPSQLKGIAELGKQCLCQIRPPVLASWWFRGQSLNPKRGERQDLPAAVHKTCPKNPTVQCLRQAKLSQMVFSSTTWYSQIL